MQQSKCFSVIYLSPQLPDDPLMHLSSLLFSVSLLVYIASQPVLACIFLHYFCQSVRLSFTRFDLERPK